MVARSRLFYCLLSFGVVLSSVVNASGSPITWSYECSVNASPPSVVPVDTPVTFSVTADPAANTLAGFPSYPDFTGVYLATVSATMAGVQYTLSAGFEVNIDVFLGAGGAQPGVTYFRELTESTDQGFFWGGPPSFLGFADQFNSDPTSSALPMPFPNFGLRLFVRDANFNVFETRVSGHLVPEPLSGTLLVVGLAVAAVRGRLRPARF